MFKALQSKWTWSSLVAAALVVALLLGNYPASLDKARAADAPAAGTIGENDAYSTSYLTLNPGANESELRLTWYSPQMPGAAVVQIVEAAKMQGADFPVDQAAVFTGTVSVASTVYASNKVTVTGLKPVTAYKYRVGDGYASHWSPAYDFKTQRADQLNIMFVGDPQIGASGNATTDAQGWNSTLNKAFAKFPDFNFIMSAGDQVNTSTSESEYAGYLSPSLLRSVPVATVIGNHDTAVNYKYHFNQPNESTYGSTSAGADYYYTYGETLFMVLNTNNMNGAEHAAFIDDAVKAVPNARWKILTFHHSIYSAANHSTETAIVNLRAALFPTIDKYAIDMVFMGHDHSYVRTYQMKNDVVQNDQQIDESGRVVNPNGITYVTANSASGSKYYTLKTTPEVYSKVRSQLQVPTYTTIAIDHGSITVNTIRTDTMEVVDTYSLVKTDMTGIELTPPAKTSYKTDEALDTTGMKVVKINKDGSKTDIPLGDVAITGFDSKAEGKKTVKVAYTIYGVKYEKTFDVTVAAPALSLKVYAKQGTVIKENGGAAVFYVSSSGARNLNALDVTLSFDASKFKLKSAEAVNATDALVQNTVDGGTLRVLAGFPTPVTSAGAVDLLKITLEPIDASAKKSQASLTLVSATSANSNSNHDVASTVDGTPAAVVIRTYDDLCDINQDGKLSAADLSKALDYYRAVPQDANWSSASAADVNFDDIVDTTDFTIIMVHILGQKAG